MKQKRIQTQADNRNNDNIVDLRNFSTRKKIAQKGIQLLQSTDKRVIMLIKKASS